MVRLPGFLRRTKRFDRRKNQADRRMTKPTLSFDKKGSAFEVQMTDGRKELRKNRRVRNLGRRKTDRDYS